MKTEPRTVILTLSALAAATSFAGLAFLFLDREAPAQASNSDQDVADHSGKPERSATELGESAARQTLDQRTADEVSSGLFSAAPGTLLSFDYVSTASSTISNHEGGVLQAIEVDLRGELEVQVLARRGDEVAVSIRLPHSKFEQRAGGQDVGKEGAGAIEASMTRPVIVRARSDGTTLGYRFEAQAAPDERNHMRTLWSALMPVAPEPLGESWTAQQEDALGDMRCNYRLVAAQDSRVEIERTSRECIVQDPSRPTPKFSGTARFGIDRGLGWFDSVVADETSTLEVELAGWMILSQLNTRCTLTSARHDGAFGIDWDSQWEPASGAVDAARVAELSRDEQLRSALDGRTLDQLVAQLDALLAAGDPASPELVRLRQELAFLLRTDADALAQVAELVFDPRLSPQVVATLIDCIGRAGTPQAQALLAQWISDSDRTKEFRTESVSALFEVKQPGENVVAAVAGLLSLDADPDLQGCAVLTMGVLANRGGSHSAAGVSAFGHVMNWKKSAEDTGRLPEWIEALGNSGSPQVVDVVRPYLSHADDSVRAAAVHALRLVFTLEVSQLAAACGQEDVSANVRGRAAEVLAVRVDNHARTAIARMLDNELFEEVRETLILYLGHQVKSDAGARALLQDAAATDPSAELRALAQQQLTGVIHG